MGIRIMGRPEGEMPILPWITESVAQPKVDMAQTRSACECSVALAYLPVRTLGRHGIAFVRDETAVAHGQRLPVGIAPGIGQHVRRAGGVGKVEAQHFSFVAGGHVGHAAAHGQALGQVEPADHGGDGPAPGGPAHRPAGLRGKGRCAASCSLIDSRSRSLIGRCGPILS